MKSRDNIFRVENTASNTFFKNMYFWPCVTDTTCLEILKCFELCGAQNAP